MVVDGLQNYYSCCGFCLICVNPSETVIASFTNRRKCYSFFDKYLGISLGLGQTKNDILKNFSKTATIAFSTCQKLFGQNSGLKPKMIHIYYNIIWLYYMVDDDQYQCNMVA